MAVPTPVPLIWGCVVGWVCPWAILTVVGDTVKIVGSLLPNVTVTPPWPAGDDSVTEMPVDWPSPMDTVAGVVIPPRVVTVIEAVAPATLGVVVLAVIVADPALCAVTGTVVLVVLAAMVTLDGTVAAAVLDELRLTTMGEELALDTVSVRFWLPFTPMLVL